MLQSLVDGFENLFGPREHVVVPEPQDANASALQEARPSGVRGPCAVLAMLPAVEFDGKLPLVTVEVQHVRRNRMLPPELVAEKCAVSQQMPHEFLSVRRFDPKVPCEGEEIGREG